VVQRIPYEVYHNNKEWGIKIFRQYMRYRAVIALAFVPVGIYAYFHFWNRPLIIYGIGLIVVYIVFYVLLVVKYVLPNRIVFLPPEKQTEKIIEEKKKKFMIIWLSVTFIFSFFLAFLFGFVLPKGITGLLIGLAVLILFIAVSIKLGLRGLSSK